MSHIRLTILAAMSLGLMACSPSGKDIEQWVKDNPEIILDSLMAHQQRMAEDNQPKPEMVSQYKKELFSSTSSPVRGNPKGKVEVAYFFDFNCGHCARQSETIQQVLEKKDNVRVVYKNLPVLGPTSEMAARAALAAHQQGKFNEFYKELYASRERSPESFKAIAQKLKLDVSKWEKDMESSAVEEELRNNRDLATKMKIGGTPFLAIAPDKVFPGRVDQLLQIIESI